MTVALAQKKTAAAGSLTLTSNTTAGNCLVVGMAYKSSAGNTGSVAGVTLGGVGDNFALSVEHDIASQVCVAIWADPSCAGGQTAVAFTLTNATAVGLEVWEFSGLATSSVVDQTAAHTGNGGSYDSTSTATTTKASEAWVAIACAASGASISSDPGSWTVDAISGQAHSGYQIVSSTGSADYSGTTSGVATNATAVATFLPAAVVIPGGLSLRQAVKRAAFY